MAGMDPDLASHRHGLSEATMPEAASRIATLTATWLKVKTSVHTQRAYRRDLGHWLTHCAQAGLDPLSAGMADVDAWIIAQRRHGARGDRPAAEATIARRVAAVSSWYTYLVANTADDPDPLASRNPAANAGRPKV